MTKFKTILDVCSISLYITWCKEDEVLKIYLLELLYLVLYQYYEIVYTMLITSNENIETVPFVIHFYDVYTTESFDLYDIMIIQRNYILSFRRKFLNNISPAEKVRYIISQNIDGLHLRSAVQGQYLAELHGNMFTEQCDKRGRMVSFSKNYILQLQICKILYSISYL